MINNEKIQTALSKYKDTFSERWVDEKFKWEAVKWCQTAHCGRCKPHFDFGGNTSPIVPYRHLPQALRGLTADCRSLV